MTDQQINGGASAPLSSADWEAVVRNYWTAFATYCATGEANSNDAAIEIATEAWLASERAYEAATPPTVQAAFRRMADLMRTEEGVDRPDRSETAAELFERYSNADRVSYILALAYRDLARLLNAD